VEGLNKSIKFYKEGLGFRQMESPPEVAFSLLNSSWLGLYAHEALAEDTLWFHQLAANLTDGQGFVQPR
jgi:hypothetical protein